MEIESIIDIIFQYAVKKRINVILPDISDKRFEEFKKDPYLMLKYLDPPIRIKPKFIDDIPWIIFDSKHSAVYRNVISPGKYKFDDLKSALQKYIRRGETEKAIFVANEMFMFKHIKGGKGFYTNFLNRLKVIALEDVGIANPGIIVQIGNIMNSLGSDDISDLSKIHVIVTTLATSTHYRYYSHLGNRMKTDMEMKLEKDPACERLINKFINPNENRMWDEPIEQLILCMKAKDVRVYYWILSFFKIPVNLNVRVYKSNKPRYLAMSIIANFVYNDPYLFTLNEMCLNWLKSLSVFEAYLCIVHIAMTYIHRDLVDIKYETDVENTIPAIKRFQRNLYTRLILDDYVYDKHTRAGRGFGKTTADFAVEGSLVAYENKELKDQIDDGMHLEYIQARITNKPSSEKNIFKLKARAQLTCGNSKTDVYYASIKSNDRNVVVKGPFGSFDVVNKFYQIMSILKWFPKVNVPHVNIKLLTLDMFEDVPLGIRKKLAEKGVGYFLVFNDVFELDKYPTVKKSSKLWPPTKVVDYDTIFAKRQIGFATPATMSEKCKISLIHQLSIRYIFEMGDFASRNFCYKDDLVYNLDVDMFVSNDVRWKKEDRQMIADTFEANSKEIIKIWKFWVTIIDDRFEQILATGKIDVVKKNLKYMISHFKDWILS